MPIQNTVAPFNTSASTSPAAVMAAARQCFTTNEVHVIASVANCENPIRPGAFRANIKAKVRSSNFIRSVVDRRRIDTDALCRKIESASPEVLTAVGDAIELWWKTCMKERLDPWGYSSEVILARVGLIPVKGPAAWGFANFKKPNFTHEFILRKDLDAMTFGFPDDVPLLAAEVLKLSADAGCDTTAPYKLAYQIAKLTKLRYFRVEYRHDIPTVVPIPAEDLASDFADRSLEHFWLKGVNAPDW